MNSGDKDNQQLVGQISQVKHQLDSRLEIGSGYEMAVNEYSTGNQRVLLLIGDYSSKKAMIYYRIVQDFLMKALWYHIKCHTIQRHMYNTITISWTLKRTTFELLGFTIIELGSVWRIILILTVIKALIVGKNESYHMSRTWIV